MTNTLLDQVTEAQDHLMPQFNSLRAATGVLKQAARLAAEEKPDALAMQKVLGKLQQVDENLQDELFTNATTAFEAKTQKALDALAFDFAGDLKATFEASGQIVEGRPPTLVLGELVLQIDIAKRKAQWFYGKEALTRLIPLSINAITRAYQPQRRTIIERNPAEAQRMLDDLYQAWQQRMQERTIPPQDGRLSLLDVYSRLVMNRQPTRFRNAPSRATFQDYGRALFVRDIVMARRNRLLVRSEQGPMHAVLGGATKAQAESAAKSIWIPSSALDGEYYAGIAFKELTA